MRITATLAILIVVGGPISTPVAAADSGPYPQLRYFTEVDSATYAMDDPPGASLPSQAGYWFTTAGGQSCGIWFRGSFGCSGVIPGAPAGVDTIGWITGDTRVHYDPTLDIRFPPARGAVGIPPLSFITVEGTTCATTADQSTYCERGPFRFLISATRTWLNG